MNAIYSCRKASQLASTALDRRLKLTERLQLSLHLMMCTGCSRFSRQIRMVSQWLAAIGPHDEFAASGPSLSAQARARICAKLRDLKAPE